MRWRPPHRHAPFLLALLSAGCSPAPRTVFVPAGPPDVTVALRASAFEVSVGTPVILYAERRSGGTWREVPRDALPADACWLAAPPPALEDEVADNVRWTATPVEPARFILGYREDHTREVVFEAPGTYTLVARSAIWCSDTETGGDTLTVVVQPTLTSAPTTR